MSKTNPDPTAQIKATDAPVDQITLTQTGYEELQTELEQLTSVKLPTVIERVATARSYGDLKENAEYHSAKEEQELIQTRIDKLQDTLSRATIVSQTKSKTKIGIGSLVTVHKTIDTKHRRQFQIVGESEAHPASGKISSASPLGAALVGKKKSDEVSVKTPTGTINYTIVEVE